MVKELYPTNSRSQVAIPPSKVIALRQRDPWREATARAREVATNRETIVHYIVGMVSTGVTQNNAVAILLDRHALDRLPPHVTKAMRAVAKAGRTAPSRSAICDWCKAYNQTGNVADLLPDHKGRVVDSVAWWGPALEYYNVPGSKPDMSAVHRRLVEVDGFAVTYDQVRHYLTSVPAMMGRNSPARIGKNLYRLTEKAFIRRSTANALAGDVYVADGYRADVYLAHPVTGDIWRPELTVAMDMRSRYPVGWRADEHEGTTAVLNMWAEAFARWNHVPPMLYVDNGSGHKNKLMSDEATGFYARMGVQQVIHAIPGNPHGKGWIERFFRSMRDDFLKLWRPEFYCGPDMAPEVSQRTVRECKAGRMHPPSLAEFSEALDAWIGRYVNRPHPEDKTVTRADLWAQLVPIPPHATLPDLKREAVTLMVRRARLKHGKREYGHPDLHAFNGHRVVLEYDLMDDQVAVIRTDTGRWICDAHLIGDIDAIAPNRLEEKRQARAKDALKRLEAKMDEQRARAGQIIDAEAVADGALQYIDGESSRIDDDDAPLLLDLNDL